MIPTNSQTWSSQDDLEWLAFQYVAGELSDEQSLAFEDRLSSDQAARDAVTGCVQMTHAVVSLAEAESSAPVLVRRSFRWQRVHSWAASVIAVAAIVTAFLAGAHYSQPAPESNLTDGEEVTGLSPSSIRRDKATEKSAASLVLAWVQGTESDSAESTEVGGFPRFEETAMAGPTFLEAEAETVVEGNFDWVLAALDEKPAGNGQPDGPDKEEQN